MSDLTEWISTDDLTLITAEERRWLEDVFDRFAGYPDLEQMWSLMDDVWKSIGCDPMVMDARTSAFYSHPVWLLNGLFIEQHKESLENREQYKNWVVQQAPLRVAEFGGGFGGLARMIGASLPETFVEVIEPHPHPLAIARAERTSNVSYRHEMCGKYDVIIATDVFEHVLDPLQMVYKTAQYLHVGGKYLIANCFYPVILCHLPQTFHFRHTWDVVMKVMGLEPAEKISYGRAFIRKGDLKLGDARQVEQQSLTLWRYTQYLPDKLARLFTRMLIY
ncbi:MAG: class I SAM-dependent methyltransferase [Gammaproteobacteria bacterium]|nr:MAG: class I SAM-dependent methyltransferase [Gammaproteobacteria bacterium]